MSFLERRREPFEADFRKLVRKHPQLAGDLEVHWTGLQAYRRLVREARSAFARPKLTHRWSPVWRIAAAGLVVVLSLVAFTQARAQRRLAARNVSFAGALAEVVQGVHKSAAAPLGIDM